MIRFYTCLLTAVTLVLISCQNDTNKGTSKPATKATGTSATPNEEAITVEPKALLKDFMTWYAYTYNTVRLAQDFTGLAADSTPITKAAFIQQLQTGKFIALHTANRSGAKVYRLYPLPAAETNIASVIKQLADTEAAHMAMEGKPLPSFAFTDVTGKQYDPAITKGKILLLKCWFINCVACVKEFPELNKLVAEYADRNDVLFVSLATDKKEALLPFLQKRPFRYAVVPQQGEYMRNALRVTAFPTHLLVNKEGRIVKVTGTIEDMLPALEKETDASHVAASL